MHKEAFTESAIEISQIDTWKEWNYTTASGAEVLIFRSPNDWRGFIFCDMPNYTVTLRFTFINEQFVTDKNGDMIFYKDDGRIAYDSKNGYPNPVLDASGNVVTTKLTADELIRLSDKAQLIMEDEAKEGDYKLFDALVEKYTEDEGMTKYPNGYYLTATSNYDSPEVVEALFEMEEGEIRKVDSQYGMHIVMKYELDEGGYADEKNADFFRTSDGSLAFMSTLKNIMLEQYVEKYKADIVVDEKLLSSVSMKTVGANYNY
jgi:hypothetical protein